MDNPSIVYAIQIEESPDDGYLHHKIEKNEYDNEKKNNEKINNEEKRNLV